LPAMRLPLASNVIAGRHLVGNINGRYIGPVLRRNPIIRLKFDQPALSINCVEPDDGGTLRRNVRARNGVGMDGDVVEANQNPSSLGSNQLTRLRMLPIKEEHAAGEIAM
jgi:hypothetical protein